MSELNSQKKNGLLLVPAVFGALVFIFWLVMMFAPLKEGAKFCPNCGAKEG